MTLTCLLALPLVRKGIGREPASVVDGSPTAAGAIPVPIPRGNKWISKNDLTLSLSVM